MKKSKQTVYSIADIIKKRRNALIIQRGYFALLKKTFLLIIAGWLISTKVFLVTQATGQGMFPAIKDGDLLVVYRMQQEYRKNDIVTYQKDGVRFTGRIVAVEADQVNMDENGKLYINGGAESGEILYPTYSGGELEYPYQIPKGYVYILGDYRTQTKDSRELGAIAEDDVEGKVITVLRRRSL